MARQERLLPSCKHLGLVKLSHLFLRYVLENVTIFTFDVLFALKLRAFLLIFRQIDRFREYDAPLLSITQIHTSFLFQY